MQLVCRLRQAGRQYSWCQTKSPPLFAVCISQNIKSLLWLCYKNSCRKVVADYLILFSATYPIKPINMYFVSRFFKCRERGCIFCALIFATLFCRNGHGSAVGICKSLLYTTIRYLCLYFSSVISRCPDLDAPSCFGAIGDSILRLPNLPKTCFFRRFAPDVLGSRTIKWDTVQRGRTPKCFSISNLD